jgi:hypothetical protein
MRSSKPSKHWMQQKLSLWSGRTLNGSATRKNPKKNASYYLGAVKVGGDETRADKSLLILQILLKKGMDMNSIHRIEEDCDFFPATPLCYAYAKGRKETLYRCLMESRTKPDNCMFAIAWNDDAEAA